MNRSPLTQFMDSCINIHAAKFAIIDSFTEQTGVYQT